MSAVARAESPDSLLVIRDVYELEKQTALDSAQEPIPSSSSMPLSYGVHERIASIPNSEYACTISNCCSRKSG